MHLRTARFGVLLAALFGLQGTVVLPVQATTYKTITFTGQAELTRGLGYPCTLNNLGQCPPSAGLNVKSGPENEPQVNLTPGGNTSGFIFNSGSCVYLSGSSVDKAVPQNGVDLCALTGSGAVTGFCGLSTGMGLATLANTTGILTQKEPISTAFKFTGVGGVLHVSGGNKATSIYAEVYALPQPTAPNCTLKTMKTFVLTGVAVYKDCTGQVANTGVCDPI